MEKILCHISGAWWLLQGFCLLGLAIRFLSDLTAFLMLGVLGLFPIVGVFFRTFTRYKIGAQVGLIVYTVLISTFIVVVMGVLSPAVELALLFLMVGLGNIVLTVIESWRTFFHTEI